MLTSAMPCFSVCLTFVFCVSPFCAAAAESAPASTPYARPNAKQIIADLKKHSSNYKHPRIMAPAETFETLKATIKSNPVLARHYAALKEDGDKVLNEPPSEYDIPDGLRLLMTSKQVLDRVQTLALLYRLNGETKYAERAYAELEAASKFPSWNPERHFLDIGEMCAAFGVEGLETPIILPL